MVAINRFAYLGDSTWQGTVLSPSIAQGGKGNAAEHVADKFASIPGIGPLVSSGKRGCWLGSNGGSFVGDGEVTTAGSWTDVVSTDAFFKAPYGVNAAPASVAQRSAAGTTAIKTWTNPSTWRTAVGYAITFVDYSGGGDWSFRDSANPTYVSNGQTLHTDNRLTEFYVAHAVAPGQSVDIRAATAAGVAAGCLPLFVEWFWIDPTSGASGIIFDNFAVSGSRLHAMCASTSGDPLACLDSITRGTGWGSASISSTPNLGVLCGHINDFALGSSTNWGTDLATLQARVAPLGPLALWNPWEANTALFPQADQTAYRAQTKASAAGFTPISKVLDLYDAYAALGYTGNAAVVAGGFVSADLTHETPVPGHPDIANRVYWFLRNTIFSSLIGGNVQGFTFGKSAFGGADGFGGTPSFNTFDAGTRATESDAANAGTARSTPTGVGATEADTASPGTATATPTGTRATETDAANAGVTASIAAGARASETDVANAGAPSAAAAGAHSTETDAAAAGTVETNVVGHRNPDPIFWPEGEEILWPEGEPLDWGDGISEYDTANAGTPLATAAGAQAAESDTANVGAVVTTVLGVQAVESDTASPGSVPATGQQASESDAASPGAVITTVFGVQAIEASSAPSGTAVAGAAGVRAVESDAATSGTVASSAAGAKATEVDVAEVGAGSTAVVGIRAVEADSAAPGTALATVTGVQAQEADTARTSDGSTIPGTRAAETDTANPGTVITTVIGTQAIESDTGKPGTPLAIAAGVRATETDTTSPGTPTTNVAGARAVEPDFGAIGRTDTTATGQQAIENDTARSGACTIVVTGGRAIEASTASSGVAAVTVFGGQASEIDVASVGLVPGATFIVTFSVRAASDGWQFTSTRSGWSARPAQGWRVEAR